MYNKDKIMKIRIAAQKGGGDKRVPFVDSVLNANKNIEWVQRLYQKNQPTIQLPGEKYPSTHLMGHNGQGYVFPHVVMINGKLQYLPTDDQAEEYARKTNSGIQFPNPQDAIFFANNGYKNGTNVLVGK